MDGRDKRLRLLFGFGLAAATLATRFPIRARTFFEFDSINFAVGTFRFDLAQVTPQMPGYILHVLFGRLLYAITGDLHLAYVWVSILLSIGSVLFLWRAAAVLRGERVGIIAALLWLTLPLFWFHGATDSIYTEEAFGASVLLYFGLKWLRSERPTWEVILYCIVLSLATGSRQTSIIFFLPATIFLFLKRRPSNRMVAYGLAAFAVLTAAWLHELFQEAGGIANYLQLVESEGNFRTQSMLFGNSWRSQFDLIGKVLFYFVISLGPTWALVLTVDAVFAKRSIAFVRHYARNTKAQFVFLVSAVPLAFYLVVFFMKAGYLLNVMPSAILVRAVLLDQTAIWLAERLKRRSREKLQLARPIITRNVVWFTSAIVALNVFWFFVPWPGTAQRVYDNEDTRNSFVHGALHRYVDSESPILTLANRAFEYTNVSGIRAVDRLNDTVLRALEANHGNDSGEVMLASWWYRWSYLLLPNATIYDLELNPDHPGSLDAPNDSLWVGRSHSIYRVFLDQPGDSVIRFRSSHPVLLLLRHDRPDFDTVASQIHLERLPLPEYLDLYKILDSTFTLRWHHRTFICSQ